MDSKVELRRWVIGARNATHFRASVADTEGGPKLVLERELGDGNGWHVVPPEEFCDAGMVWLNGLHDSLLGALAISIDDDDEQTSPGRPCLAVPVCDTRDDIADAFKRIDMGTELALNCSVEGYERTEMVPFSTCPHDDGGFIARTLDGLYESWGATVDTARTNLEMVLGVQGTS